jgi:hypothetical protein
MEIFMKIDELIKKHTQLRHDEGVQNYTFGNIGLSLA